MQYIKMFEIKVYQLLSVRKSYEGNQVLKNVKHEIRMLRDCNINSKRFTQFPRSIYLNVQ